jgi:hypothetical protein
MEGHPCELIGDWRLLLFKLALAPSTLISTLSIAFAVPAFSSLTVSPLF